MGKMLQVRNVPARVHNELKRRAKVAGVTLTDYVQRILEQEVSRPPKEQVFARLRRHKPVELPHPASHYVREGRREAT